MDQSATLRADLRQKLTHAALAAGLTPDQTASYLLACHEWGILEHGKPDWLLRSAIFRLEKSHRPDQKHLRLLEIDIERALDVYQQNPDASPFASPAEIKEAFSDLRDTTGM